jgi:hypothetical protein
LGGTGRKIMGTNPAWATQSDPDWKKNKNKKDMSSILKALTI